MGLILVDRRRVLKANSTTLLGQFYKLYNSYFMHLDGQGTCFLNIQCFSYVLSFGVQRRPLCLVTEKHRGHYTKLV